MGNTKSIIRWVICVWSRCGCLHGVGELVGQCRLRAMTARNEALNSPTSSFPESCYGTFHILNLVKVQSFIARLGVNFLPTFLLDRQVEYCETAGRVGGRTSDVLDIDPGSSGIS